MQDVQRRLTGIIRAREWLRKPVLVEMIWWMNMTDLENRGWVEKDGFVASSTEGSMLPMNLRGTSFAARRNSLWEGDIDAKSSRGETG